MMQRSVFVKPVVNILIVKIERYHHALILPKIVRNWIWLRMEKIIFIHLSRSSFSKSKI